MSTSSNEIQAICPHCAATFEKSPARTTTCKSCKQKVWVMIREGKPLLFKDQSELLRAKDQLAAKARIRRALKELEYLTRIGEADFQEAKRRFHEVNGTEISDSDVLWGLYNRAILQSRDSNTRAQVYFMMSRSLYLEGRDHLKIGQLGSQASLEHYRDSDIQEVEVLATADSCPACKNLNGRKFSLALAFKTPPLPCADCTNEQGPSGRGWCRCCYLPVID